MSFLESAEVKRQAAQNQMDKIFGTMMKAALKDSFRISRDGVFSIAYNIFNHFQGQGSLEKLDVEIGWHRLHDNPTLYREHSLAGSLLSSDVSQEERKGNLEASTTPTF